MQPTNLTLAVLLLTHSLNWPNLLFCAFPQFAVVHSVGQDYTGRSDGCPGGARLAEEVLVFNAGTRLHPVSGPASSVSNAATAAQTSGPSPRSTVQALSAGLPGIRGALQVRGF